MHTHPAPTLPYKQCSKHRLIGGSQIAEAGPDSEVPSTAAEPASLALAYPCRPRHPSPPGHLGSLLAWCSGGVPQTLIGYPDVLMQPPQQPKGGHRVLYFVFGLGDEKDRLYGGTADASRHSLWALVCDALD